MSVVDLNIQQLFVANKIEGMTEIISLVVAGSRANDAFSLDLLKVATSKLNYEKNKLKVLRAAEQISKCCVSKETEKLIAKIESI